jgi:hypothetical protein
VAGFRKRRLGGAHCHEMNDSVLDGIDWPARARREPNLS